MKKFIISFILVSTLTVQGQPRTSHRGAPQDNTIPNLMVANFCNIITQAAVALSTDDKKEQLQATAGILNSLAVFASLAMGSAHNRLYLAGFVPQDLDVLTKVLEDDEEFLRALQEHRAEICTAAAALLASKR